MRKKAEGMLLMAAIIWGGGFVAGKLALDSLTPFAVLSWRFTIAAVLCGIIFHRRLMKTPRQTMLYGLIIGGVQMLSLGLQLTGLQYTTSAKQSFLCTVYVALMPFLSFLLLRKSLTLRSILAGFISLTGIGLICLSGSMTLNKGDVMSLGFSLLFGIQVILTGRFVSKDTDSVQLSFFQFVTSALIALTISLIRGEELFRISATSAIGITYHGVLNTTVAFLLQNTALKHVPSNTASLIISLESVFGFVFSVLYFHEAITVRLLLGSALCFAAILLANTEKQKAAE